MGKLDGKVAFVTGGARGQGRSHVLTLAREGAAVVMMDNLLVDSPFQVYPGGSPEQWDETQKMLSDQGARYLAFVGDVRNRDDLKNAVQAGIDEFGRIDILAANAGVAHKMVPTGDVDPEAWKTMLDITLTGVFNSIQAVLPDMVKHRGGRIIATSSMAGKAGYAHSAGYSAAKFGVIGLIKTVAGEYGQYGITANAVCPTNVNSPMVLNQSTYDIFCPDLENPTREQAEQRMRAMHPLGIPYVEPIDISEAIVFLASDAARYISGGSIEVSGGMMAMNAA